MPVSFNVPFLTPFTSCQSFEQEPWTRDWGGDMEQTLSSASADCLALVSVLSKNGLAPNELLEILKWNQFSARKAKCWFKATMSRTINAGKGSTAQSARAASSGLSTPVHRPHVRHSVSPLSLVYEEERDGSPPRKKQRCDAWTTTEMEQLAAYYRGGGYTTRGATTAERIKESDDNHPFHMRTLKRFAVEQIAVGLNTRSAIPVEKSPR
jgi:hypothetical protein